MVPLHVSRSNAASLLNHPSCNPSIINNQKSEPSGETIAPWPNGLAMGVYTGPVSCEACHGALTCVKEQCCIITETIHPANHLSSTIKTVNHPEKQLSHGQMGSPWGMHGPVNCGACHEALKRPGAMLRHCCNTHPANHPSPTKSEPSVTQKK